MTEVAESTYGLSLLVANDDGTSNHKVARWVPGKDGTPVIECSIHKNSVAQGSVNHSIGDFGSVARAYGINGESFTVDPTLTRPDEIRTVANHQYSGHQIAMVQYALEHSGFAGKKVIASLGLPLGDYYGGTDKRVNQELCSKKQSSFKGAEILNVPDMNGRPEGLDSDRLVTFEKLYILPESVGAFMDCYIDDSGKPQRSWDNDVVVIDIGSNTIDVSMVGPSGSIRKDKILTLRDSGFLKIFDQLTTIFASERGWENTPIRTVEKAFLSKRISVLGSEVDITSDCNKAVDNVMPDVMSRVRHLVGDDIHHLSAIILVGAGAETARDYFARTGNKEDAALKQFITIPENPQFSNAKGFLKIATFMMGLAIEDDLKYSELDIPVQEDNAEAEAES